MFFRVLAGVILSAILGAGLGGCQPDPTERYERAADFMREHEYRGAIIELKNALTQDQNFAKARELLADASFQVADYDTARQEYLRTIELGDESPRLLLKYGRVLLEMGRSVEAHEQLLPKLAAIDDNPDLDALAADILSANGNAEAARARYLAVLARHPGHVGANVGMAELSVRTNDVESARERLQTAVTSDPESTRAWRALGDFRQYRRDATGAIEAYEKAISTEGR